ncbi:MAG: cytochrome C [bacterium]|nr:cytochrome C [bacterium]
MDRTPFSMRSLLRCTATLFLSLVVMFSPPASRVEADIVPPEELHPAAETYRRATFILNLNPVHWDQVWRDMEVLAKSIERTSSEEGAAFRKAISEARKIVHPELKKDEEPDFVQIRIQGSRKVFAAATRAVSRLLVTKLGQVVSSTDPKIVKKYLSEGRQIFRAFEEILPYTDPQAWKRMQLNWLEAFSHLGAAGGMGAGSRKMNAKEVRAAVISIGDYFRQNFNDFTPGPQKRLLARPVGSPTYDKTARVPWKLPPGSNINKQLPRPRQLLGIAERGVNEGETFLIALGDMAFDSPFIFGEPARSFGVSCNTCHNKGVTNPQFFIPGISIRKGGLDVSNSFFAGHANNGLFDPVDAPDLRGIRFTAPYGRNGRFASLRDFVRNVIVNEFNGPEPDAMLLDGMIAYMNEFEFLPNPKLNRDGTLSPRKASASALRGEKIFKRRFPQMMGGKSCASCHVPSAHFLDHRRHNIGTTEGFDAHSFDGAFDTPTLLSAKYSAPYFHDGSQPTLRAVSEWFNKRFKLGLSKKEIGDLTAYVETVGDGVDAYEDTIYTLDAELEEFSFFLSTYERLKRQGKKDLITTLLKTVAFELRGHKWDVQDKGHLPILNQLETLLREALDLHLQGKSKEVDAKIAAYRTLYEKNVDKLK